VGRVSAVAGSANGGASGAATGGWGGAGGGVGEFSRNEAEDVEVGLDCSGCGG